MRTQVQVVIAASAAFLAISPPSAAKASTVIYGSGWAHECSFRALTGKADTQTVTVCTYALEQETMSKADYGKTLVNRGVILMRRDSLQEAAKDFNRAEKVTPGLPEIYVNRGVVLMKQHQYAPAIVQIDKGIQMGADEMEKAYYDRAIAKEGAGDIKGAYYDYTKASELAPNWDAPKKELTRFNVQKPG